MALTNFVDGTTKVVATWLNKVDVLLDTVFNGATNTTQARTALGVTATGADPAYCLKSANLSDVTASTARGNLGAAASGLATASGLTQSTSRILGRTTAGTGALEEITVGSGLSLSAGSLTATASSQFLVPVRQTVLQGPVDTNGLSSFGGSTGGTSVTMAGTLYVTAASGFGASGAVDVVGSATNTIWGNGTPANNAALSTNGTMYLGYTISGGVATPFTTTLAPVYQWGGTPATTAKQFTFNIQTMQNYLGNGTTADSTQNAVIVGEVTVAGGVVAPSGITWYALMGRYRSALTNIPAASTRTAFTHAIGTDPQFLNAKSWVRFNTTWNSYTAGMVIPFTTYYLGTNPPTMDANLVESAVAASILNNGNGMQVQTPQTGPISYAALPTGAGTAQCYMEVRRIF